MQSALALFMLICVWVQACDAHEPASSSDLKEQLLRIETSQKKAAERYHEDLSATKDAKSQRAAVDRFLGEVRKSTASALDLARTHPQAPATAEALRFVIRTARAGPGNESEQAVAILLRDHVRDPKMGELCEQIFYFFQWPVAEAFIRAVLDQNPNRDDRGLACHALATYLSNQIRMIRRLREDPDLLRVYQERLGKDVMSRMLEEKDLEVLGREVEALLERTVSEFGTVSGYYPRPLSEVAGGELFALRHLAIGKVAPEIEGQDHEGQRLKLSDSLGKVVVLTFSGNWCGPCREMYPQERALVERMTDRPFKLLSVNTDEDRQTLRKSIETGEITWRCWWDGGQAGPITTRWGVSAFPTIYVLDREGVIRFKDVRGDALDKAVQSLIDECQNP